MVMQTPTDCNLRNLESEEFTVRISSLILVAVLLTMLPRIFTALGAPTIVNFLHFAFISALFAYGVFKAKNKISIDLIVGAFVLLAVIALSALINGAGLVNIALDFLLLAEPFMLLSVMVNTRWEKSSIERFRFWLIVIVFLHIILSYYQRIVMGYIDDDVEGLFVDMGAGSHLAGAVALTATFLLLSRLSWPIWFRVISAIMCAAVVIFSDSKQVVAVFLVAIILMIFFKIKNLKKMVQYLFLATFLIVVVFVSAHTIFPAINAWIHLDLLQEGIEQKFLVFPIIASYYDSALNLLFGLGPGHTVGRLGSLASDYSGILQPLGITMSEITDDVREVHQGHYMSNSLTGSSMFSLFFSWAGVWGDLGVFGLGAYLFLWRQVWRKICVDDQSRYLLLTILVFGGIFSWMEEPGYMLFVISIIGLRWQEAQSLNILRLKRDG